MSGGIPWFEMTPELEEKIRIVNALPIQFFAGERVWVLLRGEKKWKGTVVAAERIISSPPYISYVVNCDPDEHFPQGSQLGCREVDLVRLEGNIC